MQNWRHERGREVVLATWVDSKEKRIKSKLLLQEAMESRATNVCSRIGWEWERDRARDMQQRARYSGNRVRSGMVGHSRRGKIAYLDLIYIPWD